MSDTRYYRRYEGILTANKFATTDDQFQFLSQTEVVRGADIPVIQWELGQIEVQNRSGGVAIVGAGTHIHPTRWIAGAMTGISGTTFTFVDDTADAQNATANDFPLEVINSTGAGHAIACYEPFNIVGYNVGTASVSLATSARTLEYTASDGTWKSIATGVWYVGPMTGAEWATGERAVWWPVPQDWVPADNRHIATSPETSSLRGKYCIRIRPTTAPTTTAAVASQLVLGSMTMTREAVADNGTVTFEGSVATPVSGANIAFAVSRDTDTTNVTNDAGSLATVFAHPRG